MGFEKPAFPGSIDDRRAPQQLRGKRVVAEKYAYGTLGTHSEARLTLDSHDRMQTVDVVDAYGSSPAIVDRKGKRAVRTDVDKSLELS